MKTTTAKTNYYYDNLLNSIALRTKNRKAKKLSAYQKFTNFLARQFGSDDFTSTLKWSALLAGLIICWIFSMYLGNVLNIQITNITRSYNSAFMSARFFNQVALIITACYYGIPILYFEVFRKAA